MMEKSIREVKQSYECPSASGGHLRETQGNIKAVKCEDLTARALVPPGGREGTHTADTVTSQVASWRRKTWSRDWKHRVGLSEWRGRNRSM